jgi:hypothetical protein
MELRLLQSEDDRRIYARRMNEARAKRGMGFREKKSSVLSQVHLAFAEVYGLFEHAEEPAERMMSGFVMHDLELLPQSYPKPDLTHYPAWSVLECGELWSFSKGAGVLARRGSAIIAGLRQARAVLVYPISRPWDGTPSYTQTRFIKPCEEVEFPYGETLEGEKIWAQPMVLEGDALQGLVRKVFSLGFETHDNHRVIRFENPIELRPSLDRPSIPINDPQVVTSAQESGREEVNGASHA